MTINQIAEMAGVSRATVSRYLNNGYVSEENKVKIKKVIDKTGYVPSSQAQNLRSKKTNLIGIIIPKINSDTVSRMVAGISEVLRESGYQMLLGNASNDINEELRLLGLFQENKVDGVIFFASEFTKKHKEILKKYKIPIVIIGQSLPGFSCVYNDDYSAAKELTEKLLQKGSKPCYIGVSQNDVAVGQERQRGFEDALKENEVNYSSKWILEAGFEVDAGYQAAKKLFKRCSDFDMVICATDNIALGTMKYLMEQGKQIPEDVQIAAIGDTYICKWITPALTSVHLCYKTCGIEAAKLILNKLDTNKHDVNKEMKMGYEIVLRGTHKK